MAECLSCGAVIDAGSANATMCAACSKEDAAVPPDDSASLSWQAPTSAEREGQGGGRSEVAEARVEAQGSHWQAGESKPAVAGHSEQQQSSRGGGSLVGGLISIVVGVGCLLLPAAGEQLIESWGPAGFLIFLFAKPLGWILLALGVFLLVAAASKPKVANHSEWEQFDRPKRSRSSAYPWLLAGIGLPSVLGVFMLPAGNPSNTPEITDISLIFVLGSMASWMLLFVGIVLFFGNFLESHGLFPAAAGDWGKILAAYFVLILITGSIFTPILLLGVFAFGLARWKSYSKTKRRE